MFTCPGGVGGKTLDQQAPPAGSTHPGTTAGRSVVYCHMATEGNETRYYIDAMSVEGGGMGDSTHRTLYEVEGGMDPHYEPPQWTTLVTCIMDFARLV